MNCIQRVILLLGLTLLCGCKKNEFSIEFSLSPSVSANYNISYYASDKRGGIMMESVAVVAGGAGVFRGITRNPALVYLYVSPGRYPTVIYAERGDKVTVAGENGDPFSWKIGGNALNERWSDWRNLNATALAAGEAPAINAAVAKYVEANSSDPLSTLLLLTSFSRPDDEALYRRLWLSLSGEARSAKWVELVGRADQPALAVATPGKLHAMVMRSAGNGVDTIVPASVRSTLLLFWSNGMERRVLIDSLKALAREFPDSSRRLIADVCLEGDSSVWRNAIRYDSLRNVARLWAPAGVADSRLMTLGVSRSPFCIVVAPDGRQRYRGDDLTKAFTEFRSLMKRGREASAAAHPGKSNK